MTEDRTSAGSSGGREADASLDAEGLSRLPQPSQPSFFDRLAGFFGQKAGTTLREDLTDALAEPEAEGEATFTAAERAMLTNILRLREVRVEDVMVPRAAMQAVEIETTLAELMLTFERTGHSRMPVYKGSLDDPQGMIHIRDVLAHITRAAQTPFPDDPGTKEAESLDLGSVDLSLTIGQAELMRDVLFVPPSMMASELMGRMQTSRTQMALVIDEYGGTDGLVSLEDIVETVVGDIEDEHDEEESLITVAGDDVYVVDAKADIEEAAEVIGDDFSAGEHEEYVDTVGGMVVNALGRVPAQGEVVQVIPGFEFQVLEADTRRVQKLRITRLQPDAAAAETLPAA